MVMPLKLGKGKHSKTFQHLKHVKESSSDKVDEFLQRAAQRGVLRCLCESCDNYAQLMYH